MLRGEERGRGALARLRAAIYRYGLISYHQAFSMPADFVERGSLSFQFEIESFKLKQCFSAEINGFYIYVLLNLRINRNNV